MAVLGPRSHRSIPELSKPTEHVHYMSGWRVERGRQRRRPLTLRTCHSCLANPPHTSGDPGREDSGGPHGTAGGPPEGLWCIPAVTLRSQALGLFINLPAACRSIPPGAAHPHPCHPSAPLASIPNTSLERWELGSTAQLEGHTTQGLDRNGSLEIFIPVFRRKMLMPHIQHQRSGTFSGCSLARKCPH